MTRVLEQAHKSPSRAVGSVLLLLVFVMSAVAAAQAPRQNLVRRGAEIFTASCTSYCHAPGGAGGGAAPRLAARGFDEPYVTATISNGVPGTPMPGFDSTLSRADFAAVVAYVASLNGIAGGNRCAGSRARCRSAAVG